MNTAWLIPGRPGFGEVLIIVIVLILFFGAKRLPELARSLGKSINEFKKGRSEGAADTDEKQNAPEEGRENTGNS